MLATFLATRSHAETADADATATDSSGSASLKQLSLAELGNLEVTTTSKEPELPTVECEPELMKRVFTNLLTNAVKYSRNREIAVIEVGYLQQEGNAHLFVRDNGAGFDQKYADKLFGVFQRLHRQEEFEGTGVGLATVKRIIQRHGGKIWATSEVNKGATFFFSLACTPVSQPEKVEAAAV